MMSQSRWNRPGAVAFGQCGPPRRGDLQDVKCSAYRNQEINHPQLEWSGHDNLATPMAAMRPD
jgi:hypothetical protein